MFSLLKSTVSKTCVISRMCNYKSNLVPVRELENELRQSKGCRCLSSLNPKMLLIMLPATRINRRHLFNHKETQMSKFESRKCAREMTILQETVEKNIKNKLLLNVKKENRTIEEENFIASSPVEYRNFLKFLFDTMAVSQDIDFEEPSTCEMIKMIVCKQKTKIKVYDRELVVNYFFVRILFHLYFNSHSNFRALRSIINNEEEEMLYEEFAYMLTSRRFVNGKSHNDAIILSLQKLKVDEIWRMLQDD